MTPAARAFLDSLADDATRARFVELLRVAAEPAARDVSDPLLEIAADLCDHARVSRHRCAYCRAVVVEVPSP